MRLSSPACVRALASMMLISYGWSLAPAATAVGRGLSGFAPRQASGSPVTDAYCRTGTCGRPSFLAIGLAAAFSAPTAAMATAMDQVGVDDGGGGGSTTAGPRVVAITDEISISDTIGDAAELARVGGKFKSFVTLCRESEPCMSPAMYSHHFPTKAVLSLPLGPGLFEVKPTLQFIRQMALLPKPMLISCTTLKRSSGLAAIYVAVDRGYGADAALAWAGTAGWAGERLPFLSMPAVRQWVIASVDASARGGEEFCSSI